MSDNINETHAIWERIEVLEKNCEEGFAKVEDHVERILKVIDIQVQSISILRIQIAELRDNDDKQNNDHIFLMTEINELQKKFDKREEHQFQDYFNVQQFEEVLRDFMEIIDITITENIDGQSLEYFRDKKEELLEKLDSKPKTEKKELKPKLCSSCSKQMWLDMHSLTEGIWKCECGNTETYIKDSGGEKELPNRENGLNHSYGINGEPNVHHSKLPETIPDYDSYFPKEKLPEFNITYDKNQKPTLHCGNGPEPKTEPEKNIVGYIQEIDGLESDIEYLKKDIEELEKEKECYRIEANKDHKELIEEFLIDLIGYRGKDYPEMVRYLVKLEEKWQGRIK